MAFFGGEKKSKEDKAREARDKQRLKELQKEAREQKKRAEAARKSRQKQEKLASKEAKNQAKLAAAQRRDEQKRVRDALKSEEKQAEKHLRAERKEARKVRREAKKVRKHTTRMLNKAKKNRKRKARRDKKTLRRAQKQKRARTQAQRDLATALYEQQCMEEEGVAGVAGPAQEDAEAAVPISGPPPFTKRKSCYVCGKSFQRAPHRRRHHCRHCRESCCMQCMSSQRRPVPLHGLKKPQKVCVVCDCLVFSNEDTRDEASGSRSPAEALAGLAASTRARHTAYASRRPSSAPLPPTTGAAVLTPAAPRGRTGSLKSKRTSRWALPLRPLLKRKQSAQQLRNRKMDQDLQMEKRALASSRAIKLQPQQHVLAGIAS